MTRARKPGRTRLVRLGRPLLAAGLLAALGWAAFQGVSRSTDASDSGRRSDRLQVTRATASSADELLHAGLDEAKALADRAATGPLAAVAAYASEPHRFREAVIVDRTMHVLAGNPRFARSDGGLLPCQRTNTPSDDAFAQLVRDALQSSTPVIRALDDPSCRPTLAAAMASGNGPVAVVLGEPATLAVRLDTLAHLPNAHALFVDSTGAAVGADGTIAPPPPSSTPNEDDLVTFLTSRRERDGVADVGGAVRAWVPLAGGWAVVVDQGTTEFLGSRPVQPSNWIPAAVVGCFAFAIVVVGIFDTRRRRALARAEEMRSSFLAVVSHELRTPLTVLKGFVDTLAARWDYLEDEQRQSLVERLGPQVRRLHRGVDRLLVAADIQRGANLRLEKKPVVLADVVRGVVDGFEPIAPLHTFSVDVPAELTVLGDRKALAQAVNQLVDNAVKYSPAGGAVIVRARGMSRRVQLTVEDEGVGLPSDFSGIFEPLTQGEEVDKRVHDEGGVGVGLYIARAMVEAMGGSVRAERRTPEPGTRLVVTLRSAPRPTGGEQVAPRTRVHGST